LFTIPYMPPFGAIESHVQLGSGHEFNQFNVGTSSRSINSKRKPVSFRLRYRVAEERDGKLVRLLRSGKLVNTDDRHQAETCNPRSLISLLGFMQQREFGPVLKVGHGNRQIGQSIFARTHSQAPHRLRNALSSNDSLFPGYIGNYGSGTDVRADARWEFTQA
jgi:hypothetical protein